MDLRAVFQVPRLRRLAGWMADLVYPGACEGCGAFCDGPGPLCAACGAAMDELRGGSACRECAMPLPMAGAPCPWCMGRGLPPYQSILRLGVYQEPLRKLIHRMKYERRWTLAETLGDWLAGQPAVAKLLAQADRIVPVPLHFRRHWSRGYNQAEIIARQLATKSGVKYAGHLRRIRDTHTQTDLHSQKARRENVRGAFVLRRPGEIEGKRIVVIDDVMTTGATLHAVGRTLAQAHPASLCAVVVAVADPRGRDFEAI